MRNIIFIAVIGFFTSHFACATQDDVTMHGGPLSSSSSGEDLSQARGQEATLPILDAMVDEIIGEGRPCLGSQETFTRLDNEAVDGAPNIDLEHIAKAMQQQREKNIGAPSSIKTAIEKDDDVSTQGVSSEDEYENDKNTRFIRGVASFVTPKNMLVLSGLATAYLFSQIAYGFGYIDGMNE